MMRNIYINIVLGALVVLVGSCSKSDVDDVNYELTYFEQSVSELGYYNGYGKGVSLSRTSEQIYQSSGGKEFRIIDDETGEVRLALTFGGVPSATSSELSLRVVTSDGDYRYSVSAVKSSDGKIWLWDDDADYGVIVLSY